MPFSREFLADRGRHLTAKLRYTKKATERIGILPAVKKYKESEHIPQIIAAIKRLRDGSYGLCLDCQDEIHRDRLLRHPHVERCVSCQEDLETEKDIERRTTSR